MTSPELVEWVSFDILKRIGLVGRIDVRLVFQGVGPQRRQGALSRALVYFFYRISSVFQGFNSGFCLGFFGIIPIKIKN